MREGEEEKDKNVFIVCVTGWISMHLEVVGVSVLKREKESSHCRYLLGSNWRTIVSIDDWDA